MYIYLLVFFITILFFLLKNKNIEKFENNIYKIQDIVDQIYIINMDKDKDRMDFLDKKMKKLGLKYKRITGVDGKKVYNKYKDRLKKGSEYNRNIYLRNRKKLRPGEVGCLLSHQNILKDAIKNKYNKILILEDDILFHSDFHNEFNKKYKYLIEKENNYDLLYLGGHQKHKWENIRVNNYYYKSDKILGTFAMIIDKNIFNLILDKSNKFDAPIDVIIAEYIQNKKRSYCFHPNIITVKMDVFSNTAGTHFNSKKYYKNNKININDYDL